MAEKESRPFQIAIFGSSVEERNLICHGIIGEEIFKQNQDEIVEVERLSDELNELYIEVTSIAAFDDTRHEINDYTKKVGEVGNKRFDTMLYCLSAKPKIPTINQISHDKLKELLDASVWENCIVILTYADSIVLNGKEKYNKNKITRNIKRMYHEKIHDWTAFVESKFERYLAVIPAGSSQCYSIIDDGESWLSNLFHEITNHTDHQICKSLVKNNLHRFISTKVVKGKMLNRRINEHPIYVEEKSIKMKVIFKETIAGVGAGSATGIAGATIGSLIGALAIGIPSFGIAAGFGLVLGAVIGGGIGVGAGVGIQKAVNKSERKAEEEKDRGLL